LSHFLTEVVAGQCLGCLLIKCLADAGGSTLAR